MVKLTFHLRGRRGAWRHLPAFGVAGVALVALGWVWWRAWSPLVAWGAAALSVAGVALAHINLRFAWQAWNLWHLETSTCVWRGRRSTCGTGPGRRGTLCGRRGACSHPSSFGVAGWHLATSTCIRRGRRGVRLGPLGRL